MGWTGVIGSKADAVASCTRGLNIKKQWNAGGKLFALAESAAGRPFGLVVLFSKDGREWLYKDMDTSECPFHYHYGLAMALKKALADRGLEPLNENEATWIANAETEHARVEAVKSLTKGRLFIVGRGYPDEGRKATFLEMARGSKVIYQLTGGAVYRSPMDVVGEVLDEVDTRYAG